MAIRRWVDLARYDGAEALIATDCPPDLRNRLVVRNFFRNDLSQFGFQKLSDGLWLGDSASFKTSHLTAWFPGFDPKRDIKDFDTASFIIGYEDLDVGGDAVDPFESIDDVTADVALANGRRGGLQETVAAVRRSVDPAAIAAIVAEFPRVVDGHREIDAESEMGRYELQSLGVTTSEPGRRAVQIEGALERVRQEMATSVARYEELLTLGLDAISDYDIGIAYSGDALQAFRGALNFVKSHQLYYRGQQSLLLSMADGKTPIAPTGTTRPARVRKNPERSKERIEDAGEKIGGARKDFYAQRMALSDLQAMNDREKLESVKKEHIWPVIDFETLRQNGVDARVALFIQAMRRELPASISNSSHAEAYFKLISGVAEASQELRGREDIDKFPEILEKHGILVIERDERRTTISLAGDVRGYLYNITGGHRVVSNFLMSPEYGYRKACSNYASNSFKIGNEWVSPGSMNSDQLYTFLEQKKQEASARRQKTIGQREPGDDLKEVTSRPHLSHLVRDGAPDDRRGVDVTPEMLLADFKFRGIEFGNWLPQDERQDVLNKAYDALTTLAAVMGVDKVALSLGGTLALGFGSRGIKGAAAHYEPALKVMNLTRLNGAGCLAHEFFHAKDDYICSVLRARYGVSAAETTYYASELFLTRLKGRGNTIKNDTLAGASNLPAGTDQLLPLIEMVNAFSERRFSDKEIIAATEQRLKNDWHSFAYRVRELLAMRQPAQDHEACRSQAEKMVLDLREEFDAIEVMPQLPAGERHPFVTYLSDLVPLPESTPRPVAEEHEAILTYLNTRLRDHPNLHAILKTGDPDALRASPYHAKVTKTKYLADAEDLDSKRTKPYWGTVRELGARAFEAYVQDRCAELGWKDDYLVYGTTKAERGEQKRYAYPVDEDRVAINAAIAKYMDVVRDVLEPVEQAVPRNRHAA